MISRVGLHFAGNAVIAREFIDAWTLFGPLIALIVSLDEVENKAVFSHYTVRLGDTEDLYVITRLVTY